MRMKWMEVYHCALPTACQSLTCSPPRARPAAARQWWPYAKTMYMGMWGYSLIVLCYKNIPSLSVIGFDSRFFSERHMLIITDNQDKKFFKGPEVLNEDMVDIKISAEMDARHKEMMEVVEYEEEGTDLILGGGEVGGGVEGEEVREMEHAEMSKRSHEVLQSKVRR